MEVQSHPGSVRGEVLLLRGDIHCTKAGSPWCSPLHACLLLMLMCSSTRRYASGRFLELLLYSFNPADEDVTMELFDVGMESGLWLSDAADPRS